MKKLLTSLPPMDADTPPDLLPEHEPAEVQIGQWYWVKDKVEWDGAWTNDDGTPMKKGSEVRWLGCVREIGSNYVGLESPPYEHSSSSIRVHFDEFDEYLTFAADAEKHIVEQQAVYKRRVNALLEEVKEVTAKLGIVPTQHISDHSGEGQNALVAVSTRPDTTAYKKALVKASEETLPELFEKIKKANKELARWMIAPTMSLTASIGPMQESIGAVKDRICTIELYAGLTEEAVKCCGGAPAAITEKLRVMQRRLYMDEECLANYEAGGMEFKDIGTFDEWISRPENRDRLLPFPRTLAAFRVRRNEKEREDDGNVWRMKVNFDLQDADKKTFLYIRNGEQVWRVDCDFEFDEMIIPNKDQFNPSEPMMVRMFAGSIRDFMPRKRWESLCEEEEERYRKYKAWEKAHPGENNWIKNPHHNSIGFRHDYKRDWQPFDPTNVYFDDGLKEIAAEIKRYNRIAVIVQGLFDRSEVLHPHPPVRIWDPESFDRTVELIYDATTLTYGDPPDFELFRTKLNMLLDKDSIVTGQEECWLRREAARENRRMANDYRFRGTRANYKRYEPDGDKGPGLIGPMAEWKPRSRKATFRWVRGSRSYRRYRETFEASIIVSANDLLNVSAYKPGDFKRFFADARTRCEYLKWAPLLLIAEDYHAGKTGKKATRLQNRERE